jgi:alpha-galactosidase
VNALVKEYNFDAWKLDGCGGEFDLVAINAAIKKAGKPIMVENCHWGRTIPDRSKPPAEGCPWNFYRSSGDVRASYASIRGNLATTIPLAGKNLSYPGCWAYPDMLQVGCEHGPGGKNDPGLTLPETRTHFYAWAIVSSPLTLSHNVNDPKISAEVWPIISNTEALAVSEAYFGDSGTAIPSSDSEEMVELTDAHIEKCLAEEAQGTRVCELHEQVTTVPAQQVFYKPMDYAGKKSAVLALNGGTDSASMTVDFSTVPGFKAGASVDVRDINTQKDLGTFKGKWTGTVASHDVAFLMLTASASVTQE